MKLCRWPSCREACSSSFDIHVCAVTFLCSSLLLRIRLSSAVPWGVIFMGCWNKNSADTFCCLSAADVMLILSGTRRCMGEAFYSARSLRLHTHKKKGCQACEIHVLAGLNKKMEIISFPMVHRNPGKLVCIYFFLLVCATLGWGLRRATCSGCAGILTVHARRSVSGGSGHLAGQTGALDCLRPLLDTVLVAASVSGDYFTRAPLW